MPSLQTELIINTPVDHVWEVLCRKENWMYWNTYLYDCSFRVPLQEGSTTLLSLRRVDGDEPIEFQAQIRIYQPPFCLSWVAKIPGFKNKTTFDLQDIGQGCTRYSHQESYSGTFSRLALRWVREDQHRGMRRMARELKTHAERSR
jgi:hypothetical protein